MYEFSLYSNRKNGFIKLAGLLHSFRVRNDGESGELASHTSLTALARLRVVVVQY